MEALADQLLAHERAAEQAAARGDAEQAAARLLEATHLLPRLRQHDAHTHGLPEAESVLSLATCLAREDGPRYLPALVAATEQFARCCQRANQLERAAEAFAQAVDGAKLLALTEHTERLALAELISAQALCLAQLDRLDEARRAGERVLELARPALWRSLPLLAGTLAFLGDLELAAARPEAHRARLGEALELLEAAVDAEQPGAEDAAAKLRARLSEHS